MQLKDKSIIITGASSGIGAQTARLFAEEGARLILGARRETLLNQVAEEVRSLGGQAFVLAGDVRDEGYAEALVNLAVDKFGALDAAFNNAGIMGELVSASEMSSDNWRTVLDTNLSSAFFAAKYQIPALQKSDGGSLIFTSTFVGYTIGMPGTVAYAASKSGLIGLVQSLAVEHGAENIRVNGLLPGGTKTDMAAEMANTPEMEEFVNNMHALKRIADPLEIAQAALFLASDSSSFVTGSAMVVDGGNSITKT